MSNAVLFLGWNRPHPGTEDATYKWMMTEGLAALKKFEGKFFDKMEPIALTAHGGTTNGFVLLHGTRAKLDEMRRTDEFEAVSFQFGRRFDGWAVVPGLNGEGIQAVMQRMKA
jgi:hypothetical protein